MPHDMAHLQQVLLTSGFDPGDVDGIGGDKTAKALTRFLQSFDIPMRASATARSIKATGPVRFDTLGDTEKPTTGFMRTSDSGVLEICEHEGIVLGPYLDSKGIWTWGVGHTAAAGGVDPAKMRRGNPEDQDEAMEMAIEQFAKDLGSYEARVNRSISVALTQYQFDALVSFDFNTGGIDRALLTRKINAGDPNAAGHFMGWLKPPEIRKRRTAEMNLFKTGNYDANGDSIPLWSVDQRGRLTGILRVVSGNEVLAKLGRVG